MNHVHRPPHHPVVFHASARRAGIPSGPGGCEPPSRIPRPIRCLLIALAATTLVAVETAPAPPSTPPAPVVTPGLQRGLPGGMMVRPNLAYDVERFVMKSGDAADLARWAELAAVGYHVVAAVPGSEGLIVLLERSSQPGHPQLPAIIEKDPAAAQTLRAKIQAAVAERQQAGRPPVTPMPAAITPLPPVAPSPAPAPTAK